MRLTKQSAKKCPKDGTHLSYDTDNPNPNEGHCISNIPGKGSNDKWWCSRSAKHKGLHHAHGNKMDLTCYATWTTEEALVEAL